MRVTEFLAAELPLHNPATYPDELDTDKYVGSLGLTVDGWAPKLAWRMSRLRHYGTLVDWAIMIDAYREEAGPAGSRRRVERIDVCHSELPRPAGSMVRTVSEASIESRLIHVLITGLYFLTLVGRAPSRAERRQPGAKPGGVV